jgi:hypothetical protein
MGGSGATASPGLIWSPFQGEQPFASMFSAHSRQSEQPAKSAQSHGSSSSTAGRRSSSCSRSSTSVPPSSQSTDDSGSGVELFVEAGSQSFDGVVAVVLAHLRQGSFDVVEGEVPVGVGLTGDRVAGVGEVGDDDVGAGAVVGSVSIDGRGESPADR